MYCYNVDWCDFVVRTNKDHFVQDLDRLWKLKTVCISEHGNDRYWVYTLSRNITVKPMGYYTRMADFR